MIKIKTGSDFSGVGAFDQALSRLGIEQDKLFACDMDKYARQTYILNFGEPKYYPENVYDREIPKESLDIYMTSPPCQSFSLAGKRKGEDSKNGVLFYNSHEFIKNNNPRYFIFENVKGLLSDDNGKTFQRWIDYLGGKSVNGNPVIFPLEQSVPYHVYYQVMNAKNYGVPQNRERIFIIGIRDDADNNFSFPKPFHLIKRLKDVLENEVDEKYFLSDKMVSSFVKKVEDTDWKFEPLHEKNEHSKCVTSRYAKMAITDNYLKVGYINQDTQASQVFHENGTSPSICAGTHGYANGYVETKIGTWRTHEDGRGFRGTEDNMCPTIPARAREDGSGQPVIKVGRIIGRNPENPKSRVAGLETKQIFEANDDFEICNTLTTVHKDNVIHISANTKKGFEKVEEEEDSINFSIPTSKTRRGRVGKKVSQTLDTQCNQGIYTQQRIRRLTPMECFRLMDFNFGIDGIPDFKWNVSDSQAYKQAGNSIAVSCLVEIIKKLKLT